jgi:hypothetical protein
MKRTSITSSRSGRSTSIVEWRAAGHRLAYVAAIAEAARRDDHRATLLTTEGVLGSQEFDLHLSELVRQGDLGVEVVPGLPKVRELRTAVCRELRAGRRCVVPEADRHLALLLVARLSARQGRLVIILMRPPNLRGGRRSALAALAKISLLALVRPLRGLGVRALLLSDAMRSRSPAWPRWLGWTGDPVGDPADLFTGSSATPPPELASTNQPFVAVAGILDERKDLALVLEAWEGAVRGGGGASLVLAGRVHANARGVKGWMRPNVTLIDRHLSDGELHWIVRHAKAMIVMYDGGRASGIVNAAAATGTWIIAPHTSRLCQVASEHGLGISCAPDPSAVGRAMGQALRAGRPHPLDELATRRSFGAAVTESATSCR